MNVPTPPLELAQEPEELKNIRRKAWNVYTQAPFPDRASTLWRFSSPEAFWIIPENISSMLERGKITYKLEAPNGLLLSDLQQAVSDESVPVGALVGPEFGKFEALNLALWERGAYLRIPERAKIDQPVVLRKHVSGEGLVLDRSLIHVAREASLTIVEVLEGELTGNGNGYLNAVKEVLVEEGAALTLVEIDLTRGTTRAFVTARHSIGSNAELKWVLARFGEGVLKANLGACLSGQGAKSEISGAVFGFGQGKSDIHTFHDHVEKRTFSNIVLRVVLQDRARSAYTGLIRIGTNASYSEAFQENQNLLLSGDVRAESIPELEILTDEVQCKHGVTVGPVEEELLFYLMSRGVPREDAVRLLVAGFLEPVLGHIPGDFREPLDGRVAHSIKPATEVENVL
jgi:Fe-S cluster assembly protein SufD